MPSLDIAWSPPMVSTGRVEGLAQAIAGHERLEFLLGEGISDATNARNIVRWVGRVAPSTEISERSSSRARQRLLETWISMLSGADPNLGESVAKELHAVDWQPLRSSNDASLLLIGKASVDMQRWEAEGTRLVGSCEPVLVELGLGQEQSLAILEPFLDHADEILRRLYRSHLARSLPKIEQELEEFSSARQRREFRDDDAYARYQCGRQYREYLTPFVECVDLGSEADFECRVSPRLFVQGAARIGIVEPSLYISDDCARRLESDYVVRIREVARAAVDDAVDHIDPAWAMLGDRFGALGEIYAALEDVCTPRRRRFAADDLEGSRRRVAEFGEVFRRAEVLKYDARWLANEDKFHVAGIGAVYQLRRFDSGTGSSARKLRQSARSLREQLIASARCQRSASEEPLAAFLVDLTAERVEFFGHFYDEELLCPVGPLRSFVIEASSTVWGR